MSKVDAGLFTRTIALDGEEVRLFRSGRCGSGSCVEVGSTSQGVVVSDTKDDSQTPNHLRFTKEEWRVFLAGAKAGEFDVV